MMVVEVVAEVVGISNGDQWGVQLHMGAHTWHNLFITVVPDS